MPELDLGGIIHVIDQNIRCHRLRLYCILTF